jgi:hypothetical protein
MLRLKSLLFALPLLVSLFIATPAKADCIRYKAWDLDHDSYVWRSDCNRPYRDFDHYYFYPYPRYGYRYYPGWHYRDWDRRDNRGFGIRIYIRP